MIRVRAWSFDEAERIDRAFFERRITAAVALRARRLPIDSDGVRLVHGEADGLPGLVVDRYGDTLSGAVPAAGVERWRDTIADAAAGRHRLHAPVRAQRRQRAPARGPGAPQRLAARRRRHRSPSANTAGG
jgi:23S rRNA (cytosine1962-C5)-methyltransferase